MPLFPEGGNRGFGDSAFHMHGPWLCAVRMKGSGKMARVEGGSVDRDLQVHVEIDAVQEKLERPLVLLIRPRGAERHERPSLLEHQRGGESRAGAFARLAGSGG